MTITGLSNIAVLCIRLHDEVMHEVVTFWSKYSRYFKPMTIHLIIRLIEEKY